MIKLLALALLLSSFASHAAELFPLSDVRLGPGPFLEAQATDRDYILAMEADKLLAPFLREAGLPPRQPSYGKLGIDRPRRPMGGHYLSALALMYASTGDAETLRRLNFSYELSDKKSEAKVLQLIFARGDSGRQFDILVNGTLLESVALEGDTATDLYTRDFAIPAALVQQANGKLVLTLRGRAGSVAGRLYGVRLLR